MCNHCDGDQQIDEANAEIDRLRDELAELKAKHQDAVWSFAECRNELAALKERHERLAKAASRVVEAHDIEFGLSLYGRSASVDELGKALTESERE